MRIPEPDDCAKNYANHKGDSRKDVYAEDVQFLALNPTYSRWGLLSPQAEHTYGSEAVFLATCPVIGVGQPTIDGPNRALHKPLRQTIRNSLRQSLRHRRFA